MNSYLEKIFPEKIWWSLWKVKNAIHYGSNRVFNLIGLNVYGISDFYSPLPVLKDLEKKKSRWYKPSDLVGIKVDIDKIKQLLIKLENQYSVEFDKLEYSKKKKEGFGPGFTEIDAKMVYYMIRYNKPSNYIEVGSGLSTLFASYAAMANHAEGRKVKINCIEPYPFKKLYDLSDIEIIPKEVQDIDFSYFDILGEGDILFIDSTHVLKIDGDVSYLYLEILPRLKRGVIVHIHDIPFPYNVPHPADSYIFSRKSKPWYFTEAMILQAFLSFNDTFEIIMSVPYVNHFDRDFLIENLDNFEEIQSRYYPPCSIWIKKVG